MVSITQARDITIRELKSRFNLQLSSQDNFFSDLQSLPTALTTNEQSQLERLRQNYENLAEYGNISEESVKMVVLSPLLDLAGLYQAPFGLATEEPVELVSVDEGMMIRGKIDVLVFKQQFWVLVIESKSTQYDVLTALPQALTYMLNAPDKSKPVYGLLVNGREFVFIELSYQPNPIYARSFALSIEQDQDLIQVLSMLKHLRQDVLEAY